MSVQLSYVPVEVSLVEDFVACLTHNLFHIFKVLKELSNEIGTAMHTA